MFKYIIKKCLKKITLLLMLTALVSLFFGCTNSNVENEKKVVELSQVELEPKDVFKWFCEISKIPRQTGNEEKISEFIENFAKSNQLEYYKDENKNIIIYKEGTKGYENSPMIALQTHMDMVSSSEDDEISPSKVGVKPITDTEYIWADKTSLGADNGIGVATVLAILEDEKIEHPPIEAIFTVSEESGLRGSIQLDYNKVKSKVFLSLDYDEGYCCVASSASGKRVQSIIPVQREELEGYRALEIKVDKLLGGHSGCDIIKNRANANIIAARLLKNTLDDFDIHISKFEGGYAHNAIAEKASIEVLVPDDKVDEFIKQVNNNAKIIKKEYKNNEKDMQITISKVKNEVKAISKQDTKNIINVLVEIPDGLIKGNDKIKEKAEVSLNTGVTKLEDDRFIMKTFMRSNVQKEIKPLYNSFVSTAKKNGANIEIEANYEAWDYKEKSKIRDEVIKSYKDLFDIDIDVVITHGGLECGIFASNIPDLDVTSIGAKIENPHTVNERLEVKSVEILYNVVVDILKKYK